MKYDIFKSRDINYIRKLFTERIKEFFPHSDGNKISDIFIKEVSPSWAKDTCLNKYEVRFDNGKTENIRETSSVNKSKEEVWRIMNYIYSFQKTVSRPIYFDKKNNLLFYEEVKGRQFSDLIEKGDKLAIKKYLVLIGKWLSWLHKLPIEHFREAFYPNKKEYEILFNKVKKYLPELKKDLNRIKNIDFIDEVWETGEKTLVHADFYPGNIIVNGDEFFVIDFDKAGIGNSLIDIATLYGCLEFPDTVWKLKFNQEERKSLQETFLYSYCEAEGINLEKTKIKLKEFLSKIFLDQFRYHFLFNLQNIDLMSQKERNLLVKKLRDLISKV